MSKNLKLHHITRKVLFHHLILAVCHLHLNERFSISIRFVSYLTTQDSLRKHSHINIEIFMSLPGFSKPPLWRAGVGLRVLFS